MLLGQLTDTNTPYVAARLAEAGIDVFATHTVGDNRTRIAATVAAALERADGVVTTGGLGPTVDDVTKEAVCDALGVATQPHEPSLRRMEELFRGFGREMRANNRKQADLPIGATVLYNGHGSAPGFIVFDERETFVACMPGVPREMKPMLDERLIPLLRERFASHGGITTRVLHTIGIAESEIDHRIGDLFRSAENPKIAVLAHGGRCDVKVMAKADTSEEARSMIAPLEARLLERLADHVYGFDAESLPGQILRLLERGRQRIAVAESCTGGRIAAALTSVPGSSRSFVGGIVAYDNAVKIAQLGVADDLLRAQGAVSEAVAVAMAKGVRKALGCDIGIATTGIAGPDGGTPEKPVGLVWCAVDGPDGAVARHMVHSGDRAAIQERSTTAALGLAWTCLRD